MRVCEGGVGTPSASKLLGGLKGVVAELLKVPTRGCGTKAQFAPTLRRGGDGQEARGRGHLFGFGSGDRDYNGESFLFLTSLGAGEPVGDGSHY